MLCQNIDKIMLFVKNIPELNIALDILSLKYTYFKLYDS